MSIPCLVFALTVLVSVPSVAPLPPMSSVCLLSPGSSAQLLIQVAVRLSPNDHPLTVLCDTIIPPRALAWCLSAYGLWRGLCLSFSMTAAHTYLPFYFEAWLTGWQPWHSCRRCGACYYAYINILINTRSAIEEIITCHHSTVRKECTLLYVCVHAHTFICLFHPVNMISVPLVPPCPLMSSTAAPLIWKALCWSSSCTASPRTHAKTRTVVLDGKHNSQQDVRF